MARLFKNKLARKYGCCISETADIGGGLIMDHPTGIVIGENVTIGRNVVIYQHVTIGRKDRKRPEYPTIGSGVVIYVGAVVIGAVNIGNGTVIGANSVVATDTETDSIYCGIPARRVK